MERMCKKCAGIFKLVLGVLLLLWVWKWPTLDWRLFFGGLFVLGGLLKLSTQQCPDCEACACPVPVKGKKKR
ncbi:hypothetical protein HYU06_02605 [Candidatus Woesearchaeota archaeon]|nr:hypothetical protein [Candidatus Woesearchaeota archaeon]